MSDHRPWPRVILRRKSRSAADAITSYSILPDGRERPPEPPGSEAETYVPASAAPTPPALDAEDRERLERIAADFEIAEREITTDSLGHGGAAFLRDLARRLASHQPESQAEPDLAQDAPRPATTGRVPDSHHGPSGHRASAAGETSAESQQEGRGDRLAKALDGIEAVANDHYHGGEPELREQVVAAVDSARAALDLQGEERR